VRSNLFRPPFGAKNALVESIAEELGHGILMWSVDPRDWYVPNRKADIIYEAIVSRARDGAIVVLHDIYASTAQAMVLVIPRLLADGFELVTASELLAHFYGDIVPGQSYRGAVL
jgi:peptidoglycan/xylan/chitin deacetylase (PgdA/CDA1 family)